jgi:histidine triad (HIT) family protein
MLPAQAADRIIPRGLEREIGRLMDRQGPARAETSGDRSAPIPAECVFCRLLAGDLPANFVHRDEVCSAFMDLQPVTAGHVLVVPNRHAPVAASVPSCAPPVASLDPQVGARLFQIGQRLAAALRLSGLRCEGVNFFLADGAPAGQEVFPAHLHVIPRYAGDGFGLTFGPGYTQLPPRQELEHAAALIRKAL